MTAHQAPTQKQLCYQADREINETLQQAYWMAGRMPDDQGRTCPNPLSDKEIRDLAASNRPYAYAFQMILDAAEQPTER